MTIEVNGWTIRPHPALLQQLQTLAEQAAKRGPKSAPAKILKWALQSIFERIPADPASERFRQGKTMGKEHTGWFRDKYGGRYRLFFRYDAETRTIVPAWVNDEQSKRTRGARNDAYAVFKKRLADGNPPSEWRELLSEASTDRAIDLGAALKRARDNRA